MDNIIESTNYRGYRIEIVLDRDPLHPMRDWDTVGAILHWSREYDLGRGIERGSSEGDVKAFIENELDEKPLMVLPLYMMKHGDVALSLGEFGDRWDSGRIGYAIVTYEAADAMGYGTLPDGSHTKEQMEQIRAVLAQEIENYSQYLNGNVYEYIVIPRSPDDPHNGGYFSIEDALAAAKESIQSDLNFDPDVNLAEQRELRKRLQTEPQNIITICQSIVRLGQEMDDWLANRSGWLPKEWCTK